jgi:hypothetical protein
MASFQYGGGTFLSSPFFVEAVLPFLLVFALSFAILQKSKVLGEGKAKVDAIVAMVLGLITIAFEAQTGIIVRMIPFLAVALVTVFAFLLLWAFVYKEGDFKVPETTQKVLGGLFFVVILGALLYYTGVWDYIKDVFNGNGSPLIGNVIMFLIVAAAVGVVLYAGNKSGGETKK